MSSLLKLPLSLTNTRKIYRKQQSFNDDHFPFVMRQIEDYIDTYYGWSMVGQQSVQGTAIRVSTRRIFTLLAMVRRSQMHISQRRFPSAPNLLVLTRRGGWAA